MNSRIDELSKEIGQTEDITDKLALYMALVEELLKSDLTRALDVCEKAIELARAPFGQSPYHKDLPDFLVHLGMLNARAGNYIKAITIAYDAMPVIEQCGNRFLQARAVNLVAVSNSHLGNYYEALNHFMKALELF